MIKADSLLKYLKDRDINFFTGIPDSLLASLCDSFVANLNETEHVIAANEGSAIGLAIGHYLATGSMAVVYGQNSGIGNMVNPLTSLADPQVYGIPMLLIIGWRAEILENGVQVEDEPQHIKQGQITIEQLKLLDIPYIILDENSDIYEGDEIKLLCEKASIEKRPVALVFRKDSFEAYTPVNNKSQLSSFSREEAIELSISSAPKKSVVICTTGKSSRELFDDSHRV